MEPLKPNEVITKTDVDNEIEMINDVLKKTTWPEGVKVKTITIDTVLKPGQATKIGDSFTGVGWRDVLFASTNKGKTLVTLSVKA